jgi:UDP-N-acetylglucosamine--N-acetylmuramyl-(pentapeptide) pyrophosphoryl-undecaprenol N-acetylglucosamine transferase
VPVSVVIAGGGTGGHLYPGIAVGRALLERMPAARVTFVGTAHGLEATVVPREHLPLDLIRSAGLKGKSLASLARGLALLPVSAWDAWRVLSRRRPDVVVGVGGYSSGPVVALAALRGIPTLVLEQNAAPGLTNRLLARVVRAAAVTFPESVARFGSKAFVSGNPVRSEFFVREPRQASDRPRVLVFGGSQGAHGSPLVPS